MKNIGQVIATHRQKQGWSLEHLAAETNIPLEYVQALEDNNFDLLPTQTLVQGYVQLIAQALHVPQETALAILRRDLPKSPVGSSTSRSERNPLKKNRWIHPQMFSTGLVVMIIMLAAVFLWNEWRKIAQPPKLEVTNLENQAVVASPVKIQGQTDPETTLTINTEIVSLDTQGNFQYELPLPAGERTVVVQTTDSRGQKAEQVFFITVQ